MALILLCKLLPPFPHLLIMFTFSPITSLEFLGTSQPPSGTPLVSPALWLLARSALTDHPCMETILLWSQILKHGTPGTLDSSSKRTSTHQAPSQGDLTRACHSEFCWCDWPFPVPSDSFLRPSCSFLLYLLLKSPLCFRIYFKYSLLFDICLNTLRYAHSYTQAHICMSPPHLWAEIADSCLKFFLYSHIEIYVLMKYVCMCLCIICMQFILHTCSIYACSMHVL